MPMAGQLSDYDKKMMSQAPVNPTAGMGVLSDRDKMLMGQPAANPMAPEPGGFTGLDTNQAAINQRLAELQMLMGQSGQMSEYDMRSIGPGVLSDRDKMLMGQAPAPQLEQADMTMPMETIRAGGSTMNMPEQTITPQNNAPREIQELFSGFKPEVKLEALQGLGVGQSQPAVQNPATGGANNAEKSLAESGLQVLGAGAGNADPIPSSPGNPYILGSPDWIAYEQYASGAR